MDVNRIQQIEQSQTKNANRNKMNNVKLEDIHIINKTALNVANQRNDIVDDYINDEVKRYEFAEANSSIKYIEHFVKNMKYIVDQNPTKPKNYDEWTNEEQYKHITENIKIYIHLPDSLLYFVSAALYRGDCGQNSTDKPLWFDKDKFLKGQQFAQKHIFSIIFSNVLSLFEIFAFTDGLKPMILSQQSHTPYLAFKRYLSTARRVKNWMMEDFWDESTQAYKDVQVVRKMHRAIRLKLCEHDYEEIDAATKIPNPWCPDRKIILDDFSSCPYPTVENGCLHLLIKPIGFNQADMSATQFAFIGLPLLYSHKLGIHATDEEMIAFCHLWRSIGYVLGVQDEYNFCRGNLEEIKERTRDFIKVWVKPYLRQISPEWEHMLRCITNLRDDDMFKLSLLFLADLLNIDMPHTRSTLTFFQRLKFMLYRIFEFRKVIANREVCYNMIPLDYPIEITKDEVWTDCHIIEGQFESPFEKHLPGIMPDKTKMAYFQVILPTKWSSHKIKPICLHLAGTGDHFFWRRRNLIAKPLLKEFGIASILLENPFYGLRKPQNQIRSSLHNVCDIFIMGGCLIMESIVLLNWCEQRGLGPLGLTGLSMGGHMASLAATNWPKPISLVPCLSWSTASPVFTEGVMSASINWSLLETQYFSNKIYQNDLAKMVKVIDHDDAFLAGQHFIKHYPASMNRVDKIRNESKEGRENNNTVDDTKDGTNIINNKNDNNISTKCESENESNQLQHQIAEEKAAAKIFPLNLISNKFKPKDPNALKGVCLLPVSKHPLFSDNKWREHKALQFMRGVMDECTHLKNFEIPVDTELIIAVCARDDAYVPRDHCISLDKIWPGAEIRYIDAGHVSAYLLHQKVFRSTIAESIQRSLKKYPIKISS